IDIGFISVQPAEFCKLLLIVITATILGNKDKIEPLSLVDWRQQHSLGRSYKVKEVFSYELLTRFLFSLTIVIPPVLLIMYQPSLGNAIITIGLWFLLVSSFIQNIFLLGYYAVSAILGFFWVLAVSGQIEQVISSYYILGI